MYAISGDAFPNDSKTLGFSSFFDVFFDITIDGGLGGSANLPSASVGIAVVPEPGAGWLIAAGAGALVLLGRRRGTRTTRR